VPHTDFKQNISSGEQEAMSCYVTQAPHSWLLLSQSSKAQAWLGPQNTNTILVPATC